VDSNPKRQTTGQLIDLLTGVGIGDLVGLVGVQPDLLLAAAPFSVNTTDGCVGENSSRSVVSEILGLAHLAPTTIPCSKSHITFTLHCDAQFELQQAVFTMPTSLNRLIYCHVIG
uniref:Uncharacterized protein n=1 Tax=Amphilophus citrinellus TaxID=61819 RepID=A0A3Q0RT04_AMPCI